MRLDKYLSRQGYGNSKIVKSAIKLGKIKVNGNIIYSPSFCVENNDLVEVTSLKKYKDLIYVMLNKPSGYLSSTKDENLPVVVDLITDYSDMNLFPIGRLDLDTTGLLILSNDAKIYKKLTLPSFLIPKKYYAEFGGDISKIDISSFQNGVVLNNGYKTLPAKIEILSSQSLYITIYEGKYHEIKKMFESLGLKITKLKRVSIGEISLDTKLKEGEYRLLNDDELKWLKSL